MFGQMCAANAAASTALETSPAASDCSARCTAAAVDRNERKGKQPSDHAPVIAEFSDP